MTLSIRDIVRILRASSNFVPGVREGGFYIITEDNNELSELRWVGSQLASETLIGSGVRNKTPAVYVTHDNRRSVFCVGENNALKLFRLEDEWHEIKLSDDGEMLVHPSSRLSGSVYGSDSLVFFEDKAGHLRGVRIQENGNWESLPFAPVSSVPGSPHFVQVRDNTVFLSYVHEDGRIHQLATDMTANGHTDSILKGTEFTNDPATNFILGVMDESDFQVLALTKGEQLVCIDGEGKTTEMGKIVDGVYTPSTSEESSADVIRMVNKAVGSATGGKKKPS